MKTLIFNGSPRKNGETAYMIHTLQENLGGEYKVVDAYRAQIRPCIDCRWCFDHAGCAVKDEWQEILSYIEECDHIIIASPVYFEEVTGMLLAVMSRLQTYFSARYIRFRRKKQELFFWLQEVSDQERKQRAQQKCCFAR